MRIALVLLSFSLSLTTFATQTGAADRPNILIIMADDCTYNDLPLYGGANANTHHIDALAARGLTFNRAYLCSSMCQPCRAELYTGQYPLHNGCAYNHSSSRPTTLSLPHYLKPLGYRVGIAGKVHVLPKQAFPFENIGGFDGNCVRNPTQAHSLDGIRQFMSSAEDQPFCLVVALVEPHLPWVMGDPSQYPPRKIKLPPNVADTPLTREYFGRYLAEITYMDSQVGEILDTLASTGKTKDTLVLFTSEQGSQFPGCKWTNWDTGLHTALVAVWPEHIPAGVRTDALVQYADVTPTLVELAGGDPHDHEQIDGSSFKSVLMGEADSHRKFVYGMHNNVPEGPRYPIRTISDGRYRYIRNLRPDEIYIEKHLMGDGRHNNPYFATWLGAGPRRTDVYNLLKRYMSRPPEELYLTAEDPYEMNNLIIKDNDEFNVVAAHEDKLEELREALWNWMKSQKDPGPEVDSTTSHQAAKNGQHLYGVEHSPR